jgi:zinc/manganese transport system permease protein
MTTWLTWFFAPFASEHVFMWRALLMCVLLGLSASMLGCVLVVRRLSLMGDALAHSLLPGVGLAYLLFGTSVLALFLGGLAAGLFTALMSGLISRLTRIKEDAAFAGIFIALFASGVVLISKVGTPVDLHDFLFGNILGVTTDDLYLACGVSSTTIVAFALFYRNILLECFDPGYHRACGGWSAGTHLGLLALIVLNLVAALHALGSVLALGLFMLPAVTAYIWCDRWVAMLIFSATFAVVGSVIGLFVSYHAHLASGACMVSVLGVGFLLSAVLSPRYGLISRLLRPEHHQEQSAEQCAVPPVGPGAPFTD